MIAEIAIAFVGALLMISALLANQRWLDHHFLPSFYTSRADYVRVESVIRITVAVFGAGLALLARRYLAKFITHRPARASQIVMAVLLAFPATELILRLRHSHVLMAEEYTSEIEPSRQRDSRLGWVFVPARTGYQWVGNRKVEYAIDANGYRVRDADARIDFDRPTIVFTGESIMVGERLTWDESIPGQVSAITGLQSANVAVSGYANDQAYLRLQTELSRFQRPVAVVTLFSPFLFDRNLNDDRPHLGAGLTSLPPFNYWRLTRIFKFLAPYRSDETIERGVKVTSEVLRSTIEMARARGAVPIIVVPQFIPEEPEEREIRNRVLDEAGLPYVWVELDASWRVPGDPHPDVRAAHGIAVAITDKLLAAGVSAATK
ncbi:MAG TPA: hypothetical protein VE863_04035 [Pyrinomonadaceae bacterium]|nr:hypothetical protein [Pyrinomonadaceae bacterium]